MKHHFKRLMPAALAISSIVMSDLSWSGAGDLSVSGDLTVSGSLIVDSQGISPPPSNILWVSKDGNGDFTTISAALSSITDNSVSIPYLIKVAPGRYLEQITMKPYVDIEGSGINVTRIEWEGGSTGTNSATVIGSVDAELRQVHVYSAANWGPNNYALGVYYNTSGIFSLRNVKVSATGATAAGDCTGIFIRSGGYYLDADEIYVYSNCGDQASSYGVYTAGNLTLKDSQIYAASASAQKAVAIYTTADTTTHDTTDIWHSDLEAYNSAGTADKARAIETRDGTVYVRNSVITSNLEAVYNDTSGSDGTHLANSQIDGVITKNSGTLNCFQLYSKSSYSAVTCP